MRTSQRNAALAPTMYGPNAFLLCLATFTSLVALWHTFGMADLEARLPITERRQRNLEQSVVSAPVPDIKKRYAYAQYTTDLTYLCNTVSFGCRPC